jgi:hypothetical protein
MLLRKHALPLEDIISKDLKLVHGGPFGLTAYTLNESSKRNQSNINTKLLAMELMHKILKLMDDKMNDVYAFYSRSVIFSILLVEGILKLAKVYETLGHNLEDRDSKVNITLSTF